MKKREIKKMIQARAGLKNYSAITNIKWKLSRGIGTTKWNAFDDVIKKKKKNENMSNTRLARLFTQV